MIVSNIWEDRCTFTTLGAPLIIFCYHYQNLACFTTLQYQFRRGCCRSLIIGIHHAPVVGGVFWWQHSLISTQAFFLFFTRQVQIWHATRFRTHFPFLCPSFPFILNPLLLQNHSQINVRLSICSCESRVGPLRLGP